MSSSGGDSLVDVTFQPRKQEGRSDLHSRDPAGDLLWAGGLDVGEGGCATDALGEEA